MRLLLSFNAVVWCCCCRLKLLSVWFPGNLLSLVEKESHTDGVSWISFSFSDPLLVIPLDSGNVFFAGV